MTRAPETTTVIAQLALRRPIDLHASLAPVGRWGDDLLDRWDGRTLVRSIRPGGRGDVVPYAAVAHDRHAERIELHLPAAALPRSAGPETLIEVIGTTLVADDLPLRDLVQRDSRVAQLAHRHPGVVPVLWPDPLAALVRSISAQQVNLRWAATVRRRIAEAFGRRLDVGPWHVRVLDPDPLASASEERLRELQLTTAKSRSVIAVARAARAGELEPAELASLDDDQLVAHLTALPGIGRWSAEWFLARTLGRPRVVAGDLGVRKAVARLYDVPALPSELEVRRLTAHWGSAATLAQALALHDLAGTPAAA